MISSRRLVSHARQGRADEVLGRLPQRTFGDTAWVALALQQCVDHLVPAIQSGKPHRIANAVRAIGHAPSPEQIDDVIGAACDTVLSTAYAARNSRLISNVEGARTVMGTVAAELRAHAERAAADPARLREMVEAYVQIIGLLNKPLADRLDAVGYLAARIGSTMHLPPSAVLDVELAGHLCDIAGPTAGEAFVKGVPSLAHLAPIVRSNRESYDGQGSPDGLRADEIPLASRIIRVAATFIDLVTGSANRDPLLPRDACRELIRESGAQFDPDVLNAMLHVVHFRQRTNRSA